MLPSVSKSSVMVVVGIFESSPPPAKSACEAVLAFSASSFASCTASFFSASSFSAFIFKFENFDDFINLCSFLNNFSYLCLKEISKNFSLFYYNNTYYLKFVESTYSTIVIDYIKTLFEEFGKDVSHTSGIDGVLNEYGKVIFSKNAILKCINSFCI